MKPTKTFFELARAYKDGARTVWCKGSARSGKTVSIIQWLDETLHYSRRHRKASIVSHSFPHLNDGAIYEYTKHQMREGVTRKHNGGKHEFYLNNSILNYFSLDGQGNKAIGPGRDILHLNEPNRGITFDNYTDLKTRTTEFIVADYNPSGEFWAHEQNLFDDPRTRVIHSTWLDNLANLSQHQIQDFLDAYQKSKTSDWWNWYWKVYGLGEDAILLEERIMPITRWCSKIPKDAVQIPNALDFGWFPDPTAFCQLWVKKGKLKDDLYIKQVVYGTNLSINTKSPGASNLTDLLEGSKIPKHHLTIAECADPGAIAELRTAGYRIEAVVKSSVETSIRLFHDYNIHILEGSDKVWKEFNSYKYNRTRKGVILPVPAPGQDDHSIDGVRYVLMSRNKRWSLK